MRARSTDPTKAKGLPAKARSPFCVFSVSHQPLLVRMTVCGLAVFVSMLAVVLSRSSVLLSFFMVAMIVFMGGLQVVVGRSLMMSSGSVMMLTGAMLLLFRHLKSPSSKRSVRLRSEMPAWGIHHGFSWFQTRVELEVRPRVPQKGCCLRGCCRRADSTDYSGQSLLG
jgi:hypothetical protein